MPRAKRERQTTDQILALIRQAGLSKQNVIKSSDVTQVDAEGELDSLDARIQRIISIAVHPEQSHNKMLFFVMYDIESNKVRNLVAKYLIRQGCFRIQHSIYLANMPREKCTAIKEDLAQVQEAYDNHDSILIVPISSDYLQSMRIIGKALDVDVILQTKNTLFF